MQAPSRLTTGVLAATIAVATAGTAIASSASSGSVNAAAGISTVQLTRDLATGIPTSTDLGPAVANQQINVTIGLTRPDPAGEKAFTASLYDTKSANYHHYLSPDEFAAKFGVSQANYETALSFATAHGLSLFYSTPARDSLELTGTVAQAEATFSVSLHNFHSSTTNDYLKTDYLSNTTGPLVPAGIGVIGVLGLSDERIAKVDTPSGSLKPALKPAQKPAQGTCTVVCMGLTTPQDMWAVYDQPTADMGQGSQMAIFGEGQTGDIIADLRGFEKEMGLRAIPITVVHADGPKADYSDDAGAEEWNIDTQSSTGMSPLADREVLYFGAALTDASVLNVFDSWANDPTGPKQASASYGECEELPDATGAIGTVQGTVPQTAVSAGAAYTLMSEQALSMAVAGGKTLFSSSGDTGAGCPVLPTSTNGAAPQGEPQPNYPGSSPNAVSVGGTVMYSTGATPNVRSLEYSWNYTGGGSSLIFPEPAYQTPVGSTILGKCVGSPGGGTSGAGMPCRGVPDVAMQSGDIATNGYDITVKGANDQSGGGTSLSSPMMMGTWTRIQAAAGNTAGFANVAFYKVGTDTTKDAAAFFDVGNPTNSQPGTSMPNSSFGPYTNQIRSAADPSGWDYLSGLGVPDVAVLMKDVAGRTTPVTTAVTPDALPLPATPNGCLPSGIVTDPAGDATEVVVATPAGANQPDLDILRAFVSYDKGAQTLTFNTTVSALGTGMLGENFRYIFTYGGTSYTAEATRGSGGATPTFSLLSLGSGTGAMNTNIATLTGTFDPASNTVSTVLPIGMFNTAAKPSTLLAEGAALMGQTIDAQRDTGAATLTADEAAGTCPFIIGATAAPAVVTPVVKTSVPSPVKVTVSCSTRTSTIKVYGPKNAKLNRHGQSSYTFKLLVNLGRCKTPSAVGRQVIVYVDGHKSGILRTGKGGSIGYLVRLKPGKHTITASFVGNRDLKKSASSKLRARAF